MGELHDAMGVILLWYQPSVRIQVRLPLVKYNGSLSERRVKYPFWSTPCPKL